jgi:hypothetical protein
MLQRLFKIVLRITMHVYVVVFTTSSRVRVHLSCNGLCVLHTTITKPNRILIRSYTITDLNCVCCVIYLSEVKHTVPYYVQGKVMYVN